MWTDRTQAIFCSYSSYAASARGAARYHRPMGTSSPTPDELFSVDAYLRQFDTRFWRWIGSRGGSLSPGPPSTPAAAGSPTTRGHWLGTGASAPLYGSTREAGRIWHWLDGEQLPAPGTEILGTLDWDRRHLLMRTHTALHVLCGVVWADYRVAVTGGNMEPGVARIDFELDAISAELGRRLEQRVNEEITRAHQILVEFLGARRGGPRPGAHPDQGQPHSGAHRPFAGHRHCRT